MADRGELVLTVGRTVDLPEFLYQAYSEYGFPDLVVGDRWRKAELIDALESSGIPPSAVEFRGMGWQDGSEDVRCFQRAVKEDRIKTSVSLVARSAYTGAVTVSDPAGNLKLAKGYSGGQAGPA